MIIESIAPAKKIQCSNKYVSWIDENSKKQSNLKDNLHKIAKKSNKEEDWRLFQAQRNLVNKLNEANKNEY